MRRNLRRTFAGMLVTAFLILPTGAAMQNHPAEDFLTVQTAIPDSASPFGEENALTELTQLRLFGRDRSGAVVQKGITGEIREYRGSAYSYTGPAEGTVVQKGSGAEITIRLREDLTFADGTALTADDVLFTLYVLCDPAYTGSQTVGTLAIRGLDAYRDGMVSETEEMMKTVDNTLNDNKTEDITEGAVYFTNAFHAAGQNMAREIARTALEDRDAARETMGHDVRWLRLHPGWCMAWGMVRWGYGSFREGVLTTRSGVRFDLAETLPTAEDFWRELLLYRGADAAALEQDAAGTSFAAFLSAALGKRAAEYARYTGDAAARIEGIEKLDEYTLRLTLDTYTEADWQALTFPIAALHHYGDPDAFAPEEGRFGFVKGDLYALLQNAESHDCMGAGAYAVIAWGKNLLLAANPGYCAGAPEVSRIRLTEGEAWDVCVCVTMPEAECLCGGRQETGVYGYIGICPHRVYTDAGEAASSALRRALATVLAAARLSGLAETPGLRLAETPLAGTYGETGTETAAYSVDMQGNPLFSDGMTLQHREQAAAEAAKGFLEAAGYVRDEASARFTEAPAGASLSYTLWVVGESHPAFRVGEIAADLLEPLGITLEIHVCETESELWDALEQGRCDLYAAARCNPEPALAERYGSAAALDTPLGLNDRSIDAAIDKGDAAACAARVLALAAEVPLYCRSDCLWVSLRVDLRSLPEDCTAYWGLWQALPQIALR